MKKCVVSISFTRWQHEQRNHCTQHWYQTDEMHEFSSERLRVICQYQVEYIIHSLTHKCQYNAHALNWTKLFLNKYPSGLRLVSAYMLMHNIWLHTLQSSSQPSHCTMYCLHFHMSDITECFCLLESVTCNNNKNNQQSNSGHSPTESPCRKWQSYQVFIYNSGYMYD